MKKNVLVIWYSQTGQLTNIVQRFCSSLDAAKIQVDYCEVKPIPDFPFPWKDEMHFYSQMPACVGQKALPLQLLNGNLKERYDVIVLGFQPWFLHPSIPTISIFENVILRQLFKDTPVITIIGARNMWLNAQEIVKEKLIECGATLIGHIALVDQAKNLASVITVQRWMFKGLKDATFFLPRAGISELDIARVSIFGALFSTHLLENTLEKLHAAFLSQQSVIVKSNLIILERTGVQNFRKLAAYIDKATDTAMRLQRLRRFAFILSKGVFILTPISSVRSTIIGFINQEILKKEITYFTGIKYQKGQF